MDVIIDDAPLTLPSNVATRGEVLNWIEIEHLDAAQCVTRVLFDGREANYRKPTICNQKIHDLHSLLIESGDVLQDELVLKAWQQMVEKTRAQIN
jgi:hypothetical protein